jgi:epothilone polyketide synthase D
MANECLIESLTPEIFSDVAEAKVTGAWNLHTATQGRPLDFFVCFSSIASLWGSAAQAHYAAANHFLDMLCEHRRSLGQPGLAIGWGPWSGGGMVTSAVQARLVRTGLDLLDPAAAMTLFGTLIGSRYSRVAAVNVRWEPFVATFTARRPSPFVSRFLMKAERVAADRATILPDLDVCTDDQLRIRLRDHIRTVVAESLGVGRVPDGDRGFFDMGLDSLAVVAIRGRLSADFGAGLSNADMFNYSTINALTGRVMQLLRPGLEARAADPVEPVGHEAGDAETMSPRELMERIGLEFDALGNVTD